MFAGVLKQIAQKMSHHLEEVGQWYVRYEALNDEEKEKIHAVVTELPPAPDEKTAKAGATAIYFNDRERFDALLKQAGEMCGVCQKRTVITSVCCNQPLCPTCMFNIFQVCACDKPKFAMKCPFCREEAEVPDKVAKEIMKQECPSRSKIMTEVRTGRSIAVHHIPYRGCYGKKSKLMAYSA